MLLSLHEILRKRSNPAPIFDGLLEHLITTLRGDFSLIADCGAGVGGTALPYADSFKKAGVTNYKIICFEPLPENVAQLQKAVAADQNIEVRPAAVTDYNGTATFHIPSRVTGSGSATWPPGTSFSGYISSDSPGERIDVPAVRLDSIGAFHMVKADLQGGELAALKGLGPAIRDVKLIYSEFEVMKDEDTVQYLVNQGFTVFFDRLLFSYRGKSPWLEVKSLARLGLEISQLRFPTEGVFPPMLFGYFTGAAAPYIRTDGRMEPALRDKIIRLGIPYIATDLIAVNPSILPTFSAYCAGLV